MALITENPRIADVLLYEKGEEFNYVRDAITLVSGGAACVIGQALGQITKGAITAAAKGAGNTGNGTVTALSNGATAKVGAYTLTFLTATTYTVSDPNGVALPNGVNGAYTDLQVNFTVTAGGTAFITGDGFVITVAAGSGKWVQVGPANVDGSQSAAGICLLAGNPTSADTASVAVTRGPAILKLNGITWTSGMTSGQKTTALAQLQALGITTRTDYGV